jgi:hypothetical protein
MKTSFTLLCVSAAALLAGSSAVLAQQKTVKACQTEWQANKADNQARGITEKAYIEQCRSASEAPAAIKPTAAPAAAPAAKPTTPLAPAVGRAPAAEKPSPSTVSAPSGANQFVNEALAKAHCPRDIVVWANLDSKIYHFSGHKDYGNTKEGAYMCEKDALGQGIRAAKNEKHP